MGIYFDVPLTVGDRPGCGVGLYFHDSPILLADKTFAEEPLTRWRPDLSLQVNPDGRLPNPKGLKLPVLPAASEKGRLREIYA